MEDNKIAPFYMVLFCYLWELACKICKIVYNKGIKFREKIKKKINFLKTRFDLGRKVNKMNLEGIEKEIGYTFQNKELLKTALTHTSYAYEKHIDSNEKLEFLGDSILEFLSSRYLFTQYKNLKEGEMTKVRATVVCEKSLYKIATKHHFGEYLLLGKSEKISGGNKRPAILADSVEAVIAAIYLDGGLEPVDRFIVENLKEEIKQASQHVGDKDYKTVLQEKLQEAGDVKIEYEIIKESGPDHDKSFEAQVRFNGKVLATGSGKSKKSAEMQAAKKALENLK